MERLDHLRATGAATAGGGAEPRSGRTGAVLAFLLLLAPSLPASAGEPDPPHFESISRNFRYREDYALALPPLRHRLSEERSVEAPTAFEIKSVLQYTVPLGDTGMFLKIKAPLKKSNLVKIEIRF
jgi:hypothetical protein